MADDLLVILKAKELMVHTLRITSNANRYPKKFRFSLVDKMQNKSMEIYENLLEANRTDIRDYRRDRQELQTKAITYCDELLTYIEISHELGIINEDSIRFLGFHHYVTNTGKYIRKLTGENKRKNKRKFRRLCKAVNTGKVSQEKFNEKYTAWKNHASHGNCIKLCHSMDLMVEELLIGSSEIYIKDNN